MGNQQGAKITPKPIKPEKLSRTLSNTPSNQQDAEQHWPIYHNLISEIGEDEGKNLYVALYDFKSGGENQLDLVKGEVMIVLEHNQTREWARVEKKGDSCSGWVPANYIASAISSFKFPWFHGPLSRNGAEYILSSGITGSFLVRDSESCPGQLTISVRFEELYFHYKVHRIEEKVYITEENSFSSLDQLVQFYSQQPGLKTCLLYPVHRVNKPTLYALCPDMEEWEISRSEFEMKQLLGSGQYGDVYEGRWKKHNITVAVKTLKDDTTDIKEFLKEVTIMKDMKHPNLVQLLGVCTKQPPFYIVTEFLSQGNLLAYLHSNSSGELTPITLFYMATQVASAMVYLEQKNFIHRDLAARNCLVGENHLVKVADFGLARLMDDETYTAQAGCKFPIKWTAPEGLAYSLFSTKSDVWAFGILLWELATYGQPPYPELELAEVYGFLERGSRLPCPVGCLDEVYKLMLWCWKWDASERPTFHKIHDTLENIQIKSDFSIIKEPVKESKSQFIEGHEPNSLATSLNKNSEPASAPLTLTPNSKTDSISNTTRKELPSCSEKMHGVKQLDNSKNTQNVNTKINKKTTPTPETTPEINCSESLADAQSKKAQARLVKPVPPKPTTPSCIASSATLPAVLNKKDLPEVPEIQIGNRRVSLPQTTKQHPASGSDIHSSKISDKNKITTVPFTQHPKEFKHQPVSVDTTNSNIGTNRNYKIPREHSFDLSQLNSSIKEPSKKPPITKPKPSVLSSKPNQKL